MECQINTIPRQQITFVRVDACDEDAIQSACEAAVQEEGRLDVFFANVRARVSHPLSVAIITSLPAVGWYCRKSS